MNYWERQQIFTAGNFLSLRHIKETLEKEETRVEEEEEFEYAKSTIE